MTTKREELTNPEGCLNKAADDEPVFVLRAQDRSAPRAVRAWAAFAKSQGCPSAKVEEALNLALRMEDWQHEHSCKWPD